MLYRHTSAMQSRIFLGFSCSGLGVMVYGGDPSTLQFGRYDSPNLWCKSSSWSKA